MRFPLFSVVVLLAAFATSPCRGQFIVAHRGASHDAPENTLAAFQLAWEQGADAIEGDFYLTSDKQIVCIHDRTTERTAPDQPQLTIAEATLAELRNLDVGRWKNPRWAGERIPTLSEVLATVPNGKTIFVEIKSDAEIVPLLKLQFEQSGLQPEQIVMISFDKAVIVRARTLMPMYKANWLTGYKENDDKTQWTPALDDVLASLKRTRATGLGTKGDRNVVDAAFAKRIINAGFELHVWTINDPADARHFAQLGAASITSDQPAAIRRALQPPARSDAAANAPPFTIERTVMTKGYDGTQCWVHARAGAIPPQNPDSPPTVVITTQRLDITGSDVFHALNSAFSRDLGTSWSPLIPQKSFERWPLDERTDETICDFTPQWHEVSHKLLGIGHSVRYFDNKIMKVRPRFTGYSIYNPASHTWEKPKRLNMPDTLRFHNCGAGSVQRYDLPDGIILLPVYFKSPEDTQYSVTVCRCGFDGETLTYIEHGSEMTVDVQRGFVEPSLTKFGDRFYLTLRNDEHGYVTSSTDGLNYDKPRRWTFDDGSDLGNYNTQQHWVTNPHGLYLVYTRKGADNDHVFRHRAPLFIAQIDPEKLQVIRATEQILVPERGARLGNFGVADIRENETWVVVTEWMQTWKRPSYILPVDNEYGADNSVYIAKIKWETPHD